MSPQTYRGLGRIDDAVGVLRADFVRQPSVGAYRVLLDFAAGVDRVDTERTWAFDHARQLAASDRFAAGAVLVQLYLSEGDIDAAWQAADRYGPGWAWRELADRGAEARPVDAADLYRPQLESDLRYPNTKLYPDIAATLATMAETLRTRRSQRRFRVVHRADPPGLRQATLADEGAGREAALNGGRRCHCP